MGNINFELFIMQMILIFVILTFVLQFMKINRAVTLEKRISKYTVEPINGKADSIFDKLTKNYEGAIASLNSILSHSHVLKDYSKKYNKYIEYSSLGKFNPMSFISMKILIITGLLLLVVFSNLLRYSDFTFFQFFSSFCVGFFLPDIVLFIKQKRREKQIDEDMIKAIIIMNSAFKSGRTTIQAIEIVKNELSGPIGEEFKKMYIDISFGLSLDVVFQRFSKRIDNDDAKYISASLTILNKTGGDIVKVFSSIEKSLFDRRKIRNELKSLTASSEVMFKLLTIAPFVISLVIFILNPSYFNPLFSTTPGLIVLGLIILIFIMYIYFIKRMMKIRV